jgi:alanyl-tRNA synthetase
MNKEEYDRLYSQAIEKFKELHEGTAFNGQTGLTLDGKPVLSGVYQFHETHGLPLDIIFSLFEERNWVPDWIDFYNSALKAGMKHKRILSKLSEALTDSFGKEWEQVVISNLDKRFGKNAE